MKAYLGRLKMKLNIGDYINDAIDYNIFLLARNGFKNPAFYEISTAGFEPAFIGAQIGRYIKEVFKDET
jgi:hypothetical protein